MFLKIRYNVPRALCTPLEIHFSKRRVQRKNSNKEFFPLSLKKETSSTSPETTFFSNYTKSLLEPSITPRNINFVSTIVFRFRAPQMFLKHGNVGLGDRENFLHCKLLGNIPTEVSLT